jgi:hypothetical protein
VHQLTGGKPALSKNGDKVMSQRVVFYILISIFCLTFFNNWLVLFSTSSMPGPRLQNGIIFGMAEAASAILAGLLCRNLKDTKAIQIACAVGSVSCIIFNSVGGAAAGIFGLVMLFI